MEEDDYTPGLVARLGEMYEETTVNIRNVEDTLYEECNSLLKVEMIDLLHLLRKTRDAIGRTITEVIKTERNFVTPEHVLRPFRAVGPQIKQEKNEDVRE